MGWLKCQPKHGGIVHIKIKQMEESIKKFKAEYVFLDREIKAYEKKFEVERIVNASKIDSVEKKVDEFLKLYDMHVYESRKDYFKYNFPFSDDNVKSGEIEYGLNDEEFWINDLRENLNDLMHLDEESWEEIGYGDIEAIQLARCIFQRPQLWQAFGARIFLDKIKDKLKEE